MRRRVNEALLRVLLLTMFEGSTSNAAKVS